jgi:transcriptional regulator GlxA family with amidase domain
MIHVSLPAIPEAGTTLLGAMELLGSVGVSWQQVVEGKPADPLFDVTIVSESGKSMTIPRRWSVEPHSAIADVARTDVIFIPSLWMAPGETFAGRHGALKEWIARQYRQGAMVCAACTGVLLLADTGLLDGEKATTHWAYEDSMRRSYPRIELQADKVMVESGADGRLVTSGSHATWYDVILHVISRTCGRDAAMETAKFFLLQWHTDGQLPYRVFQDPVQHGDAAIRACQEWLRKNFTQPNPVEAAEKQSGVAPRSFKRRFKSATGMTVIDYVQRLRVEQAKALLEGGDATVDDIGWRVGYEDVAFFRRLFKRLTGLTPREYRKKFQLPQAGKKAK